jgi:uncharacterized protein YjbI with pentapeptide repeats
MANDEHLQMLQQGVAAWDEWRKQHRETRPDFSGADLRGADLIGANLSEANLSEADLREADLREADLIFATLSEADLIGANLRGANLSEAELIGADLRGADLRGANLRRADLMGAELSGAGLSGFGLAGADLRGADLRGADLMGADLSEANLMGANLRGATLVGTNLCDTNLTSCSIYGISAWDIRLERATQRDLVITPKDQPSITVDNLEVAQFIYLLLNNPKIRDVIDTVAKKAVLILGRFTPERKVVLDAIKEKLREHDKLPILFDFETPQSRDFTETVNTLAHLAQFIIADLTSHSSIPHELQAIIPQLEIPVQPLLLETQDEYAMFIDFRKYDWILPTYHYKDLPSLLASLEETLLPTAEKKAMELTIEKAKRLSRQ